MRLPIDTDLESEKQKLWLWRPGSGLGGVLAIGTQKNISLPGCNSRTSSVLSHILAKAQHQARSRDHTVNAAVTQRAPPHFIFIPSKPYKYSNDHPIPSILPTPPAPVLAHCHGGGAEGGC